MVVNGLLSQVMNKPAIEMTSAQLLLSNTDFSYFHGLSSSLYKPLIRLPFSVCCLYTAK